MDYQSIKEKYSDAVKNRRRAIQVAKWNVDRAKIRLDYLKEEREQYRQKSGEISAYKAKMWGSYHSKISKVSKELADAEIEYAKVCLGQDLDKTIDAIMAKC